MRKLDLNLDSRFDFAVRSTKMIIEKNRHFRSVFDIGSGDERVRGHIENLGLKYYSFDKYPSNKNVRKWDLEEEFPYEEKADIVIMLEVVEHLMNPLTSLKYIYSVLN